MLVSIPPKCSVAELIGLIKVKSSLWIAQNVERKANDLTGHKLCARVYFVSTLGQDKEKIRAHIKKQKLQDQEIDQLALVIQSHPRSSRVHSNSFQRSPIMPPA